MAYIQGRAVIPNSCISFDYYVSDNLNIKLNFIPYGFEFSNTYSQGRQIYVEEGDDSGFLKFWAYSTQFNVHISYYFLTLTKKT